MTATTEAGPVTQDERIHSLDILRGIAVLGILLVNIQAFPMIGSAYFNPSSWGDLTGINLTVWIALQDPPRPAALDTLFRGGAGRHRRTRL